MNEQLMNIKLVEEVEKHEMLYNYNLPEYSRRDLTEKAWQEVAAKMNLTAHESKEKWRNLRTVFIRKMKEPHSSSGRKKRAYYLADAMKFSIPFIRTLVPPSNENLSETTRYENTDEFTRVKNTDSCYDDIDYKADPIAATEWSEIFQQDNNSQDHPSSSQNMTNIIIKNEFPTELDTSMVEYIPIKKAKLGETKETESNNIVHCLSSEWKDSLRMFLLSLLPEVEHFNNDQIRLFKRRIFNVIDDISSQSKTNS